MKVTTCVRIEDQEIEVNVSIEDITAALDEIPEMERPIQALIGINNIVRFLKAITDELIAGMTEKQRELVRNFLDEQSNRYKP